MAQPSRLVARKQNALFNSWLNSLHKHHIFFHNCAIHAPSHPENKRRERSPLCQSGFDQKKRSTCQYVQIQQDSRSKGATKLGRERPIHHLHIIRDECFPVQRKCRNASVRRESIRQKRIKALPLFTFRCFKYVLKSAFL